MPVSPERKLVTVLFVDIVGSTELIGDSDPEKALAQLAPALTRMGAAVRQFNGTVISTMGDGLVALFGVPFAREDHALCACQAALAMQGSSARHNLQLRVGVHTGEVVAGAADQLTNMQNAYGAAIHLASRVEHMAEPGDICMTEATFRLVRASCDSISLGQRTVRSFSKPIGVYRLLGLKPATTSQQFRNVKLATFRGRDAELQILGNALREAKDGHGSVFGLRAPSGVGKSRLCFEFAERCRQKMVPVVEARASPYNHSGPLQPLLEFLYAYFRITPDDPPDAARAQVVSRLEELSPALHEDAPAFLDILRLADPADGANAKLDPGLRQRRLFKATENLLRLNEHSPTVVIIEDVHWLDEGSGDFISTLINAALGSDVLLLLSYRSNYEPPWRQNPGFEEITFAELDEANIAAVVDELLGTHPSVHGIRKSVVERSGGNSFFAEELIRELADQGAVAGEPGRYVAIDADLGGGLPATIHSVISARIDRLLANDKVVLQIGAIVGREFPLPVLQEVSGLHATGLESALDRLCDLELVQRTPANDQAFAFRHPLIQEVAYAAQLKTRRTELHAAVAKAIEKFHHNRLDEYADLVAHHYEAAGDYANAAKYAARAALWIGTTHSKQGLKAWKKVRTLLEGQPRSSNSDSLRMMASGQIVSFGWREGMSASEAAPFAEEALELARATGNVAAEILLVIGYGRLIAGNGSADHYVEHVQRAFALLKDDNASQRALLQAFFCQAYGLAGKLREALTASEEALARIDDVDKFHQQIIGFDIRRWVESMRARVLVRMGELGRGSQSLESLIAEEARHPDPAVQFIPHYAQVELAWLLTDPTLARRHSERINEIARKNDIAYVTVYAEACEGVAKSLEGDHLGAILCLQSALQFARKMRAAMEYEPEMLANLAEVQRRADQIKSAIGTAHEAIALSKERGARLAHCRALITLAAAMQVEGDGGQTAEATVLLRRARSMIEETGAGAYVRFLDVAAAEQRAGAAASDAAQ